LFSRFNKHQKKHLERAMKNLKTQMRFALLLSLILLACTAAFGQLTPSGDSYTSTATPTKNFGTATTLGVESSETTFIQFNLSSIPSSYTSANITQATLKLYVNAVTTAGSFNVDYVNGTWTESTIDASNAPALGTTIAASVPLVTADKNQYILINVTEAVQAWLSGTANDGIALVGNSPVNATFDSKETTSTSHPAELDIVFAGGGGSGITGITTASGSGLIGGGTSGTLNLSLINTCASKQILQWSGSAWACASPGTGTITGVTAGTDLTGGGTSGTVTVNVDTTKVPQLASANTFTTNQTVNGTVIATSFTGSGANLTGVTAANSTELGGLASSAYAQLAANNTFTGTQTVNNTVSVSSSSAAPFTATTSNNSLSSAVTGVAPGGSIGVNGTGGNGVRGTAATLSGTGVYGQNLLGGGLGVFGNGATGVYGEDNVAGGIGVSGSDTSGSGIGVSGSGGTGVSGTSSGGTGVFGTSSDGEAAFFQNDSSNAPTLEVVNDEQSSSSGLLFDAFANGENFEGGCTIDVNGDLDCNGTITNVVGVKGGARKVALYSMQSPENWFEDFGSGSLSNGAVTIKLDPTFAQTVNTGTEYHVFLTPNGDSKGLYVSQKSATSFEVREQGGGSSNVAFDYRIVAKRSGYENVRLADLTDKVNRQDAQRRKMQSRMHPAAAKSLPQPPAPPKAFDQPKLPALSVHAAMKPMAAQTK
jgi:hypothetical protein